MFERSGYVLVSHGSSVASGTLDKRVDPIDDIPLEALKAQGINGLEGTSPDLETPACHCHSVEVQPEQDGGMRSSVCH